MKLKGLPLRLQCHFVHGTLFALLLFASSLLAESRTIYISKHYLNLPVARAGEMRVFQIAVDGIQKREFPVQLAEQSPDYWIFIDVSEFQGKTVTFSGRPLKLLSIAFIRQTKSKVLVRCTKSAIVLSSTSTVKRGWSNDVNGPIFYKGQYHLFWQAFPFGVQWDTGFMYWGHAVSKDLIHWQEMAPALMLDRLGSPWSGSSLVDHNNDGGWERMRWCWSIRPLTAIRTNRCSASPTAQTME